MVEKPGRPWWLIAIAEAKRFFPNFNSSGDKIELRLFRLFITFIVNIICFIAEI